ncbi:lysozyme family protein [Brucella intermedia]|uniref:hypothetical protein n=1 Tax=Brucella intermedia TaxID=94625 RepID=UPI00224ACF6F|nr:hypothetical protein [Brucella intermedia]
MFEWLKSLLSGGSGKDTSVPASKKPDPVATPTPVPSKGDDFFAYRPLFNLLGKSEGTDKGRGYNETLSYGAYTGGPVNLVGMTLAKVDALQTQMLKHPANKWNSSAVGRYQVVRTTLRKVKKALGFTDDILYGEECQDTICLHLLNGRGLSKYLAGTMKEDTFINNLAKEWASLPTTSGKGYYDNQKNTPIKPDQVRKALAEVKARLKD